MSTVETRSLVDAVLDERAAKQLIREKKLLLDLVDDLKAWLEDRSDITADSGSEDPTPNEEMRWLGHIDDVLDLVRR